MSRPETGRKELTLILKWKNTKRLVGFHFKFINVFKKQAGFTEFGQGSVSDWNAIAFWGPTRAFEWCGGGVLFGWGRQTDLTPLLFPHHGNHSPSPRWHSPVPRAYIWPYRLWAETPLSQSLLNSIKRVTRLLPFPIIRAQLFSQGLSYVKASGVWSYRESDARGSL